MKKIMVLIMSLMSLVSLGAETKDYTQYKSKVLVSPSIAKEVIEKEKNVVVVDVRSKSKYMIGHIKGSYNMWRPDMEPKDGRYGDVKGMRASREELEKELSQMGINNDSTIVLLGDNLDEYRLWWIMDLYGAEKMKIVDGGYTALKEAGVKTKMGREPGVKKGNYKFPKVADKDTLITFETLKKSLDNKEIVILDTRSLKENNGTELKKGAFVKGKIPGSVWVEWSKTLDKNKKMKPYNELVNLYTKAGVVDSKEIIAYCQSAVRSAHTTFVLKELLGYKNVKNYDGSWIEWSYQASKNNAPIK